MIEDTLTERSFNDIAQDILDIAEIGEIAPQIEPLIEEWFVTLTAVQPRRYLREQSLKEQLEAAQRRIAELEQSWHDSASMTSYTASVASPATEPVGR